MTGHLFIHIGPPKTATTALQYGLQNSNSPNFRYLGVNQPRNHVETNPVGVLHACASGHISEDDALLITSIDQIHRLVMAGNRVVISEEMFLVWETSCSFWKKLDQLEKLVKEIPHTYLITLRDPCDALPSYYQELYSGLSLREKIWPKYFFLHERCDCYDYSKIFNDLERRICNFRTIDFDELGKGQLKISELLGGDRGSDGYLELPRTNVGKRSDSGNERELSSITIADMFRFEPMRFLANILKEISPHLLNHIRDTFHRTVLLKNGPRNIHVPKPRQSQLTASYQAAKVYQIAGTRETKK